MGTPKALLDWHGAPLVHRVAAILARACDPVVVVAAPGQELPLPAGVEVAEDAVAGRGPLEGVAAGRPRIAALLDGARVARLPVSRLSHPHAVRNANTPEEYERLLGLPEPAVRVVAGGAAPAQVEAATVARAVARIRPDADVHRIAARVNGLPADGMTPLVAGDLVELPSSPPSR
jgi:hypothetical protein